jgi:hypothetical protein
VEGGTSIDANQEGRYTRVIVYYSALAEDPGESPDKYANAYLLIDEDLEAPYNLAEPKAKIFYANWIFRFAEASALASRWLLRYSQGAELYKFRVELKDSDLGVGQYLRLKTQLKLKADGSSVANQLCQVLKKQFRLASQSEFTAINSHFDQKYLLIAPALPQLNSGINQNETNITMAPSGGMSFDQFNSTGGIVRIENELIQYSTITLNNDATFTLAGCQRGFLDTGSANHPANTPVLPWYSATSDSAKQTGWGWIGDAANLVDSNNDGIGDLEGFYIY